MEREQRSIKSKLIGVGTFVAALWVVFLADRFLPLDSYALRPRTLGGLPGVLTMPFLHEDPAHILKNTIPLIVLMTVLVLTRGRAWHIFGTLLLATGMMTWLFCANGRYLGASALVFALIGYLVVGGIVDRRPVPLLVAIVIGSMYGGTVILGILPLSERVSELSHFLGLLTGAATAYGMSLFPRAKENGGILPSWKWRGSSGDMSHSADD